jgi:hypothetical protein
MVWTIFLFLAAAVARRMIQGQDMQGRNKVME